MVKLISTTITYSAVRQIIFKTRTSIPTIGVLFVVKKNYDAVATDDDSIERTIRCVIDFSSEFNYQLTKYDTIYIL